MADLKNPQLNVLRRDIDLAAVGQWEASLYPNPSFLAEVEGVSTRSFNLGRTERKGGFSQPVIIGGRRGAAMDVAAKQREITAINYLWQRREILTQVKRAYYGVLAAKRDVTLTEETRDVSKTFHDLVKKQFEAEDIPETPLLKAAVGLAKAEIDLKQARNRLAVQIKSLKALLGNVDFPAEKFSGELGTKFEAPTLDALRLRLIAEHPRIKAAKMEKERAELEKALAEAEGIPDINLELLGGVDEEDGGIIEGGIEIPFPIFNRNQAKVAAADIRIKQAEFKIQRARNIVLLQLTITYKGFAGAQDQVKSYTDTILPKARKALDQTREGYRLGNFTFLEVLDAQRTMAEARIAHLAALSDLNEFAAELEKLIGSEIGGR